MLRSVATIPQPLGRLRTPRCSPKIGAYLTDGTRLFRVTFTRAGARAEESLIELVDCATLELLLCSARQFARAGLLAVNPALAR